MTRTRIGLVLISLASLALTACGGGDSDPLSSGTRTARRS